MYKSTKTVTVTDEDKMSPRKSPGKSPLEEIKDEGDSFGTDSDFNSFSENEKNKNSVSISDEPE